MVLPEGKALEVDGGDGYNGVKELCHGTAH